MATELATRPQQQTERIPGDFARHPSSGAPFVSHPTRRSKPTGKKAELLAQCEALGIEPAPKATVKDLVALLTEANAGEPSRVQYGRPSGFGKQIENSTNLQKWAERAVALGVLGWDAYATGSVPPAVIDLFKLPDEKRTLDDPDARPILDKLAAIAKRDARASEAAERGSHTHVVTEDNDEDRDWVLRAQDGEDLGLPTEVQQALVNAWNHMLAANAIEVLAVEAKCVDDRWRLAGTLDRIVRLTIDLSFVTDGGEVVTIPAGTVLILDVKTGQLRTDSGGHPIYWHSYAIQVASYGQSVPYDVDTDTRGEWPWPIDQKWAIIAHLDVLAALDGEAVCRLVLVDLEAGREAGDLVMAAKAWEHRRDVFSLVGPTEAFTAPVVYPENPKEESCPTSTISSAIPESTSSAERCSESSISSSATSPSSATVPSFAPSLPPMTTTPALPNSTPSSPSTTPIIPPFGPPSTIAPSSTASAISSMSPGIPGPTPSTPTPAPATSPAASFSAPPTTGSPSTGTTVPAESTGLRPTTTSQTPALSPVTSPPVPTEISAPVVEGGEVPSDDGDLPAHEVLTYAEARADDLNRLAFLIADWPEHTRAAIARLWPTPDVLAYPAQVRAGEATWTDDDLPMLRSIFTGASAPFNIYTEKPSQPVTSRPSIAEPVVYSGYEPADPADIELLLNAIRESGEVETVNRWLGEAHGAGVGWSPRKMPNVRCFEICRTALALADVCGDTADDVALALIDLALDAADTDPTEPVGAVLGQLTPQQAADVAEQAAALKAGRTLLVYDADGYPILTPAN